MPHDLPEDVGNGAPASDSAELSPELIEAIASDSPLVPPREPLGVRLASYFGRHQLQLFVLSFFCLWAILCLPPLGVDRQLKPGQLAPTDYVATQSAYLLDEAETQKRRDAQSALVTPAYVPNRGALASALAELPAAVRAQREKVRELRAAGDGAQQENATPGATELEAAPIRWETVELVAGAATRATYEKARIRSDVSEDIAAARRILRSRLVAEAKKRALSPRETEIAFRAAAFVTRFSNVVVDVEATEKARQEARDSVLSVFTRVEANTPIVRAGERISAAQWRQLDQLGLVTPRFDWVQTLAYGALCLMLVSGGAAYLGRSRRDVLGRPAALWLVAFVPVLFLLLFRFVLRVPYADSLMIPLAATAAMLITVLLDTRMGLPAGFVVAALCALMARADAGLFLAATLSAWIGALSVANLSSRFALLRSMGILAVTNGVLAASLGVLRDSPLDAMLSNIAWQAGAGVASVVVMASLAIFLERPFGITSQLRLLELLSPDEKVMQRMQIEAPGTFSHSLMVGLLAEAGAKAVGADSLLCRVSGLYHDIGKLHRPHCFIENQSGENIHDRLSPGLSALLIKAHVKDGLELGRAIRLPAPVLDAIATHHGQTLVSYFYNRAKAQSPNGAVEEQTYRYGGPRPKTKESAIVMLADSVEASSRTLQNATPERLQAHIQKIVGDRLREGELSQCALSLAEIGAVQDAFLGVMKGVLHGRITYPDPNSLRGNGDWVAQTLGARPANSAVPSAPAAPAIVAKAPENAQNKNGTTSAGLLSKSAKGLENTSQTGARRKLSSAFHATRLSTNRTSPKTNERRSDSQGQDASDERASS